MATVSSSAATLALRPTSGNKVTTTSDNNSPTSCPSQDFQFITVSSKALRGDAATRKRVRSHAQADYRRRNRKLPAPRPALRLDLDVSAFLGQTASESSSSPPSSTSSEPLALGPITRREFERSDMYGLLQGNGRARSQLLWDHLYDGTCIVFKSMLQVGFIDIVRESTALTQMLSASAWHLGDNGGMQKNESTMDNARYSVVAARLLRERLSIPQSRASIEVVIAVLAFASFANLMSDPQLINIHLDGLSQVLGHRGGLASVESMPVLRIMIYWVDLHGGYLQDISPRFPQPFKILSMRSNLDFDTTSINRTAARENLHQDPATSRVCHSLKQLHDLIEVETCLRGDAFWDTVLFPPFHLSPILHDLLSMPRATTRDSIEARQRECFRLAAILYLTELRGKFTIDTLPAIVYAVKLWTILKTPGMLPAWGISNDFLVWILTVAACCSCVPEALQVEYVELLPLCLRSADLRSFDELRVLLSGFGWCDAVLGPALTVLEFRLPSAPW